jgi:predicted DNA-binding transcriptional regulator AlpA
MNKMIEDMDRLMRLPEVLAIVARSRASWYRLIKDGKAPKPIVSGHRFAAWRKSDIKKYLEKIYEQ